MRNRRSVLAFLLPVIGSVFLAGPAVAGPRAAPRARGLHAPSTTTDRTPLQLTARKLQRQARGLLRTIKLTEHQLDQNMAASHLKMGEIEVRENEIKANQQRKRSIGIFGALMGMPMVAAVSMFQMMDDDGRLKTLRADLGALQAQHADLTTRLAAHKVTKGQLIAQVNALATSARPIQAQLDAFAHGAPADLAEAGRRVSLSTELVDNLRTRVGILGTVAGSARTLGVAVEAHLANAEASLAQADKLAQESQKAFVDLLMIALAKNPNVAAGKWINKRVVTEVTKRLVAAGLKGPAGKEIAKQLAKKLVDGTKGGKQGDGDTFAAEVGAELDAV